MQQLVMAIGVKTDCLNHEFEHMDELRAVLPPPLCFDKGAMFITMNFNHELAIKRALGANNLLSCRELALVCSWH